MTQAISDMETAYNDAAWRTNPTATELAAGSIGGLTIAPGLCKWGTAVGILSDVQLAGAPDDVWIFQIAQTLDVASDVKVTLAGGAQAKNVFWQVGDQATFDTTSSVAGNVLTYTAVVVKNGATLDGRALAQTAVTLDSNAVTKPAHWSRLATARMPGGMGPSYNPGRRRNAAALACHSLSFSYVITLKPQHT